MTMEEEEHTDRKQRLAMLCQKINKLKKCLNEDDTDNVNQVIDSVSPDACHSYLLDLEKKGNPHLDHSHLTKLLGYYTRAFSNMPLQKHCQNESYARMLVRFAELTAIQDVNEAEANFNVAQSHSQNFAFVHIAHAQFEQSQGNLKRSIHILQNALELGAKPKELLEAALQKLRINKAPDICSDDKENVPMLPSSNFHDSTKKASELKKVSRISDGTDDLPFSVSFGSGTESLGSSGDRVTGRCGAQRKRTVGLIERISFSIPEKDDEDDDEINGKPAKKSGTLIPASLSRQTSGSNASMMSGLPSSKKNALLGDSVYLRPQTVTPEQGHLDNQAPTDSTTTLLNMRDSSRMEDVTYNFDQVVSSNSPESCWTYLTNLEKRGSPHTDVNLCNKLKDCCSKVFTRLPIRQYSNNASYARILVRYAELKGIEDPDEAQDHFIVARSNCKTFAFVHIAHAQFEVCQGNVMKAMSILQKAQALNARPPELLEVAIRNLKAGEKQLVPTKESEHSIDLSAHLPVSAATSEGNYDFQAPPLVSVSQAVEQPKPASKEPPSAWKAPALGSRYVSPEDEHKTPDPRPVPRVLESFPTPSIPVASRPNPPTVCKTPNGYRNPCALRYPEQSNSAAAAHRAGPTQQPVTPLNQASCTQTPQASFPTLSNESITIKGKQFFVLKKIGRGGSSKVYQVLDHKKQLFAVKYVDLEEADAQTVESYKNEIEHLNHLQQYSDQIIKLYDYEITNSYIYMLMECGNLDLNTWLRNRKTVNPLERKFYWKNMLEAVQTIHKHGIVHSDLKPANFVIVNASLKLIDFGIANQIQPDVTSIMKDSQVGTLNYMPPEAIKDTSSQTGKARSKISPKGDVWSLGCILYCMTYGKTPFQSITNQITKLHAILNPSHEIEFPDISEKDLLDVLKKCLVRNPKERISIAELLEHPYLQLKPQPPPEPENPCNSDLKKILTDLAALQSPTSIVRAANNLAKMCGSGRKLDVAECVKSSTELSWKMQ